MSNFHPKKSSLFIVYEVVDAEGQTISNLELPAAAIEEFRNAPVGSRLLVSGWEIEDMGAHLVGQPLDITELIGAVRGGWVW